MRIVYLGTGEIGIPALSWLAQCDDVELVGVVTQPDRPAGRGKKMQAPPVKRRALELGIPIEQPASVNTPAALAELKVWDPELVVVCAFGQILKAALLEMPPRGCINIHASLLPRHRGASCIQAALLAGDTETGITIIQMDQGLDTGDCLAKKALTISKQDTASGLHDRLAELAPRALEMALRGILNGALQREVQHEALASYAPKLTRQDGEIDWFQPVQMIERRMRALYSWPGSYTFFQNTKCERKRLKVLPPVVCYPNTLGQFPAGTIRINDDGEIRVAGADGELALAAVQPEGAKVMKAQDWARGAGITTGHVLG